MSREAGSLPRRRREPPRFRTVAARHVVPLSPFMTRVTLGGEELVGFEPPQPAASVRLLLPIDDRLTLPEWNGNEFLLPGGSRAPIRTFTPLRFDTEMLELDIDIVLHDGGAASAWVEQVAPGDQVAVSGPGRGYQIDPAAGSYFLAGDETALPAIGQLMEVIDETIPVSAIIEIRSPDARIGLPDRGSVTWVERPAGSAPGSALIPAVTSAEIPPGTKVWVAGEAGSLVPIRKHLRDDLGLDRSDVTVRGYWKHGR